MRWTPDHWQLRTSGKGKGGNGVGCSVVTLLNVCIHNMTGWWQSSSAYWTILPLIIACCCSGSDVK